MKTILALLAVSMLTGCAAGMRTSTAAEAARIPNDCSNKTYIIRYLEDQSNMTKGWLQSEEEYEANRSAIRGKIWELRTACQQKPSSN
jgi:outer membrane lipopolysaccharide assembly protein LptE/RlpB